MSGDTKPPKAQPAIAATKSTEGFGARLASRALRKGINAARPLVPLGDSKRNGGDLNNGLALRSPREPDTDKTLNIDSGPAARDGRQFTVSNVGNNGRIYLRPSVRHPNQRSPPAFHFPVTPPGTSGFPAAQLGSGTPTSATNPASTQWTRTPKDSPVLGPKSKFAELRNLARPKLRRAMSDSTIHDTATSRADVEPSQPGTPTMGDGYRPRTMDDLDAFTAPVLNINIPSWRIGTPRFTLQGTPLIRGSSYAPTEDFRSSRTSGRIRLPSSSNAPLDLGWSRHPTSSLSFQNRSMRIGSSQDHALASPGLVSPRLADPSQSTYASYAIIEPEMFTSLTFPPACNDRSIVRYSSHSRAVTAATPPRLVAEITSPSFLDYELISDFFLTYRAFLESTDLTRMLFARMHWALTRQDEVGMIVRVRTFVAVRHWVLNYFVDDFLLDYELRCLFCHLLNNVVQSLSDNPQSRRSQLKVIVELKKCWRRICAHYWDGPDFDENLGVEVPLVPGGIAGYRDPNLDPSFWENNGMQNPAQISPGLPSPVRAHIDDASKAAQISDFVVVGNRPMTPEHVQRIDEQPLESPRSASSLDVLSCAFPMKGIKNMHQNPSQLLGAHPVPSSALVSNPSAVATAPKALMPKRSRPSHSHKRSNSMSDSLREHLAEKRPSHDHEGLVTVPSARSLVRGNVLPPGQAFVDMPSSRHGLMHRQTTVFQSQSRKMFFKDRTFASAMSAAGMKKLLGSVRKAISNRGQPASPSQANIMNFTPVSPPGAASNSLDVRTAVVPQQQIRQNGARPVVRIDLLGAEVAEDFKAAVREEDNNVAAADSERLSATASDMNMSIKMGFAFEPPANNQSPAPPPQGPLPMLPTVAAPPRPISDSGVTNSSRSIVIRPESNMLRPNHQLQREPSNAPSVDTYAESFIPATGDPTPPNTPPTQPERDVPRRSSYLLNQHVLYPTMTADDAPPMPSLQPTSSLGQSSIATRDMPRRSMSVNSRTQRYPPTSQGLARMHRRTRSSRTQSMSSLTQRTYSGELLPATTYDPLRPFQYSQPDEAEQEDDSGAAPEPLRVLRRRPGGDLKAAKNVNDLQQRLLRRSQSVGSFATYTDSMRSSWIASPEPDCEIHRDNNFARELSALGHVARDAANSEQAQAPHSSKPPLRASFEAQAQKLRQIADDEDDDGIDAALRKLEGRYDGKSNRNSGDGKDEEEVDIEKLGQALQNLAGGAPQEELQHTIATTEDEDRCESIAEADTPREPQTNVVEVGSFLSGASAPESRTSIALLDRDPDDESHYTFGNKEWADRSVYHDEEASTPGRNNDDNLSFSLDASERDHDQAYLVEQDSTQPTEQEDQSFLEDASVAGTDLSSEMSDEDADGRMLGDQVAYFSSPELPSNPMGASFPDPVAAPLSPSQTTPRQPLSPTFVKQPLQTGFTQTMLPTPDATPTAPSTQTMPPTSQPVTSPLESPRPAPQPDATFRKFSVHLPFILAFDSEILTQQFTLIEKDALNEIDWKDLIDMNWKNTASSSSRSWVDFLRNSEAHGVEVVIARFNIMVKWAISEIVLTQNMEERARCIIKMIHIAAHCRRYRNFATLAQLTIALTSNEVGRLSKTWDMVPSHDLKTLEALEALVTPTRNFFHLRAEMEVGTDTGCIPFVGIYTHDLLYNAQRPSEIASSPNTPPLVNFERSRIAASVIKVLLRLLESSTHYKLQPLEGVTERCLWVGALSDDDIRRHSSSLE